MDPMAYWEVYRPSETPESFQIAILTSSYETWGKTIYDENPRVRVIGDNGEVWELLLAGRNPSGWKLWRVSASEEEKKEIPLLPSSRTSRWGHPEPALGYEETQPTQSMPVSQ